MPSWRTRAVCLYIRATRKRRYRTPGRGRRALAHGVPAAPPPRRLRRRLLANQVGGFPVLRLSPTPGDTAPAPGALVYFHGGAFVNGIARQHWRLIAHLADATRRGAYVPCYGLAPGYTARDVAPFLHALQDYLRPYAPLHLLGDSAGGNLALRFARSHAGTGVIAGLTLIAPWLDLSLGNPGVADIEPRDPWLSPAGLRVIGACWAGDLEPGNPAVNPLTESTTGLPPTVVFVGTRDICLPDCELLAEQTPSVTLHVEQGSPHVYPLLPTPEGRAARDAIVRHVAVTLAS